MFCLVVAISDGDTLTARCGAPGAYRPIKVRVAAIDALKPNRRLAPDQNNTWRSCAFGKRPGCSR